MLSFSRALKVSIFHFSIRAHIIIESIPSSEVFLSARFVLNAAEHDKLGDPLETNPVKSLWDEIHVTRMSFPAVNRLASPITFWSSNIVLVIVTDQVNTRN